MSTVRYYFDFDGDYLLSHLAKAVLQYNECVVEMYQRSRHLLDAYSSSHLLDLVKLNSQSVVSNCMLDSNSIPKESQVSERYETTQQSALTRERKISNVSTPQQIHSPIGSAGKELQDVAVNPDKLFSPIKVDTECDILKKQNLSETNHQSKESSSCTEKRTPMRFNKNTTEAGKFSSERSQLDQTGMDKTEPVNPELHRSVRLQTATVSPKKIGKVVSNSKIEADRKCFNPDIFLFKSMPRLTKSSRGLEIEISFSSQRPANTIPTPVSLMRSKITKPVADESVDKKRFTKNSNSSVNEPKPGCSRNNSSLANLSVNEPKPGYSRDNSSSANISVNEPNPWCSRDNSSSANLSVNEPKPECSRDNSSSAKISITRTQQGEEREKSPIRAGEDIGKDPFSSKSTERNLQTNLSPSIEILIDGINQLRNLIKMREGYMKSNHKSLTGFQKCLGYLIIQIENILNIVNLIQINYYYCLNEDFIKNINGVITTSVILINNLVSMRLDIKKDIKLWSIYYKEINHIRRDMGQLLNGKPSVDFDSLQKYEDILKSKWERIDNTIPILESRISLFLNTAGDFEKCIKLFVKCLINVGVLKLSLTPAL